MIGGTREIVVMGVLIVGAGPSGLATAAALKMRGLPSIIIEREDCVGSLWQYRTYDRLSLHIPKEICELPGFPFPSSYPRYPSRDQFVEYLKSYARHFQLKPLFRHTVVNAKFDEISSVWRVAVKAFNSGPELEFVAHWLVVASGENCDPFVPYMPGLEKFKGSVVHSSLYKNGEAYKGKKTLVIGSGNSGMEIALDLALSGALPTISVRGKLHVLPRDIFGISTFTLSMLLLRARLPMRAVDTMLLIHAWFCFGDLSKVGLHRPSMGPLTTKLMGSKTPVLDRGTVQKIKDKQIKVVHGVSRFSTSGASFVNDPKLYTNFDAVIVATGFKTNISKWLQDGEELFDKTGQPTTSYPKGWKGKRGLFAAGLTRRGLMGVTHDAQSIANNILDELLST